MGDLIRIELIFHCLCKTGKGRERLRDMTKDLIISFFAFNTPLNRKCVPSRKTRKGPFVSKVLDFFFILQDWLKKGLLLEEHLIF